MKDSEIRGLVLRAFYEKRHEGFRPWAPSDFPESVGNNCYRIAQQLWQQNLLDWHGIENGNGTVVNGAGEINAYGVDVIEGNTEPPISITFDYSNTVNVSDSTNVQIGNNNTNSAPFSVENFSLVIDRSNFSPSEKVEAKSLWQKVCENKLLNTVVGSVFGAATKHALETTTQPK